MIYTKFNGKIYFHTTVFLVSSVVVLGVLCAIMIWKLSSATIEGLGLLMAFYGLIVTFSITMIQYEMSIKQMFYVRPLYVSTQGITFINDSTASLADLIIEDITINSIELIDNIACRDLQKQECVYQPICINSYVKDEIQYLSCTIKAGYDKAILVINAVYKMRYIGYELYECESITINSVNTYAMVFSPTR